VVEALCLRFKRVCLEADGSSGGTTVGRNRAVVSPRVVSEEAAGSRCRLAMICFYATIPPGTRAMLVMEAWGSRGGAVRAGEDRAGQSSLASRVEEGDNSCERLAMGSVYGSIPPTFSR
jgi:hypothetical protein